MGENKKDKLKTRRRNINIMFNVSKAVKVKMAAWEVTATIDKNK